MAKILENQLFAGKSWNGFTTKNHFLAAFNWDNRHINDKIIDLMQMNLGEDFYTMIASHGTYRLPAGKDVLTWRLKNAFDENYELLSAFEDSAMTRPVGTTPGFKAGANGTHFFMLFEGKPFDTQEIIVGMKPDLYRLWIVEKPRNVGGSRWLYKVQLQTNSLESFIPNAEIAQGTRWSSDGGMVADSLSYEGFDVSFRSHAMMEARLTAFRLQHKIAGNMFNVRPLGFYVKGKGGKSQLLWISNVEFELMRKIKSTMAHIVMDNHSNVMKDGTVMNIDKNGQTATAGAGWKQQWSSTNLHTWNLKPDLTTIRSIILDAVVGKIGINNRNVIITAGEYGLTALSDMVQRELGSGAFSTKPWATDTSGKNYKWNGNEVNVKMGQIMGYADINGINVTFVVDPSKDDPKRNKIYHPLGGLASSYEYDIMGFGGVDEKSNMQIIRREGEDPIFGSVEGIRGFFAKNATSFSNPKQLSTPVDGSTIHYFDPGIGGVVWDPSKVVRYYPELTQS